MGEETRFGAVLGAGAPWRRPRGLAPEGGLKMEAWICSPADCTPLFFLLTFAPASPLGSDISFITFTSHVHIANDSTFLKLVLFL